MDLTPPCNLRAEQALLGALLVNNVVYERVAEIVVAKHFFDPVNAIVWEAAVKRIESGGVADALTLKSDLEGTGRLDDVGGVAYLGQLLTAMVGILNAVEYAREVRDCWLRRELIAFGESVVATATAGGVDGAAQIESASERLYRLASVNEAAGGPKHVAEIVPDVLRSIEAAYTRKAMSGLPTGLHALDVMIGGLNPSDLIVVAGRPGMGKSALVSCIAMAVARGGVAVDIYSLEMSGEQVVHRMLADVSGVATEAARKGELFDQSLEAIVAAAPVVAGLPIYVDDQPALSISTLRLRAIRGKRVRQTGLVIVDYLQLATASSQNRAQEVGQITGGLKALAKELGVPVVGLAQLSRKVEDRADRRPQMSDLRESGQIEQDADVILFLYREEVYIAQERPKSGDLAAWIARRDEAEGRAEIIIGKNRHGRIGTVPVAFDKNLTRFHDC
jgi:replicative DNA helicase